LGVSLIPVDEAFVIDRRPDVAQLDAAEVRMPLTLRGLAQGDKFMPFGMSGTKLVSDYLTNAKISLYERKQQLVVVDGEGRIVWLVGRRIDARFAIGKSTTKSLVLTVG
jgi:tRNA(Ile)-lysidine synthase